MRKYFILLSLFLSLLNPVYANQTNQQEYVDTGSSEAGFSSLKYKIWVWHDSFQIQFIDPSDQSSVIIYIQYSADYSKVLSYEIEHSNPERPNLNFLQFTDPNKLRDTILELNLNNLQRMNLIGPTDFVYKPENRIQEQPVFPPLRLDDEPYLVQNPSLSVSELDMYRFRVLVSMVLSQVNLISYRSQTQNITNSCAQYL